MPYNLLNTKKLYYGIYPYKLTLSFHTLRNKSKAGEPLFLKKRDEVWQYFLTKYGYKRLDKWKKNWEFRISESYWTIYVYLKNFRDVEELMARYSEFIHEYERPESPEQLAALQNEAKIVIKDTLYFNTFRWRLGCKVKTLQDCDEISDWLNEYGDNAGWKSYEDWVFTSSSGSIYLKDEKQIMLLRLLLGPKVKFVEKVVLKNEIESSEASNG